MSDDDEVLACPDCDRTPVVTNAPGGRSHGSSEKYRCARCGWKGDEPRRRPSRGDPELRADSIAAKLDEADSLDELVTDGGVDQEDGGTDHDYEDPSDWEDVDPQDRLFAPGHVEEWELAVLELRELLEKLEDPDFRDSAEMAEVEEAVCHEFDEVEKMFRIALDTKRNEVRS